jgi:hypothetical protein
MSDMDKIVAFDPSQSLDDFVALSGCCPTTQTGNKSGLPPATCFRRS